MLYYHKENCLFHRHSLIKITILEPVDTDDDIFIKYLIVFKKWLAVEEMAEDKEDIKSAFAAQIKPKTTLR